MKPGDDIVIIEAFDLKAIFKYLTFYKILYYKLNIDIDIDMKQNKHTTTRNYLENFFKYNKKRIKINYYSIEYKFYKLW